MKVVFVEFDVGEDKKERPYYRMSIQGRFSSYGKMKTKIVDVNLTREEYKRYKDLKEGASLDLDFVIPLPEYPLTLTQKN